MEHWQNNEMHDPQEDDLDHEDPQISLTQCPKCQKPVTDEMDSCPFCGDILFRYLQHSSFVPRKGPLTKIVAIMILILIAAGILAFILQTFRLL